MDMDIDDEPPRRPIEANLAQALAWGAPLWILDKDGPPPQEPRGESRCAQSWPASEAGFIAEDADTTIGVHQK